MFEKVSSWLDRVLVQEIPDRVVAFCFNLYEDENDSWSMEMVGTESFDLDDDDWGCDEVTDFGTREDRFIWQGNKKWNEVLDEMISVLEDYLEKGVYAEKLKERTGVGIGFVDGDIAIIHHK